MKMEIEYGDIWVGKISVGQGRDGSSVITDKLYGGRGSEDYVTGSVSGIELCNFDLLFWMVILTI